jgi:hypothetical protein
MKFPRYIYQMKFSLTLLPALFLCFTAFAQHRSSLEISAGASLPIGDFANKNVRNERSGVAKMGQTISIACRHLLTKKIGFAVSLSGYRHPLDIGSVETSLADLPGGTFVTSNGPIIPPPAMPNRHYQWEGKKDAWLTGSLLAGPCIELPINAKTSFVGQIMAGAAYIHVAGIHMSSVTDTAIASFNQTEPHAIGFAYALESGLSFKLTDKLSLLGKLQYFGTPRTNFGDGKTTITEANGTENSSNLWFVESWKTSERRQTLSAISLSAGLRISL